MHGCRIIFAAALLLSGPRWLSAQPVAAPEAARPAPQPPAADFKTADDLLTALETADHDLVSLTAGVKYDRTFELAGDRQVRFGKLWFVTDRSAPTTGEPAAAPAKKFAIHFDRVFVGPTRRGEDKTYIFDGRWMMEKDGEAKFFQKKQIVGPGEHFDPLKIGQGPFVMPIGQRRADITARYKAELLPAADGLDAAADASAEDKTAAETAKKDVQGAWQLHLTPLKLGEEDEFTDIRLWYKRGAQGELLPRMARTTNRAGDISCVLLVDVQVQLAGKPENKLAAVDPAILDTQAPAGWDGNVEPWRKPGAANVPAREGPDAGDK